MILESCQKMQLYRRIVQAKLFIDARYGDAINLENIADEACFSKFHFIRTFKRVYGKTPHHYLTWVRVERAKELLTQNRSVADACFSVAFDSPTTFAALFKRSVGLSPSAFQRRQRQRRGAVAAQPFRFVPKEFYVFEALFLDDSGNWFSLSQLN